MAQFHVLPRMAGTYWSMAHKRYGSNRTWAVQREKGMSWHSCFSCRVANLLAQHVRAAAKFSDGWPHFWVQIWTQKWGPELDHIFIPSFRSLLGPRFGVQIWTKSGVSHRRILLLPAEVLQADLRRTSMSASVNTCFFSLCVPLCFLYSRGPFLAAMFLLVFWILFWEPWWSRFVGIRGAPRLTEACPRHAWQELLWKKPPLRTSACGRHRRQARMCVFPQRGAYSWWTWTTIPWKPWKFAEKHGQRIAYSWFNSIKRPY